MSKSNETWVTINGNHVCIDSKSGKITKGPDALKGKTVMEASKATKSGSSSAKKSTAKKTTTTKKSTTKTDSAKEEKEDNTTKKMPVRARTTGGRGGRDNSRPKRSSSTTKKTSSTSSTKKTSNKGSNSKIKTTKNEKVNWASDFYARQVIKDGWSDKDINGYAESIIENMHHPRNSYTGDWKWSKHEEAVFVQDFYKNVEKYKKTPSSQRASLIKWDM